MVCNCVQYMYYNVYTIQYSSVTIQQKSKVSMYMNMMNSNDIIEYKCIIRMYKSIPFL